MTDYILGSLLFAWFLSWFDFDDIFVNSCNELFKWNISTSTYYFVFFLAGVVLGVIKLITTKSV